jgi:signal transduction histidine kinase
MGYAEMALEALPRGSRTWEHVRQVWKAGGRARGVIDQILAFSRRGDPERRPVRMRTVCEEAIDLLRASLPAAVAIELRVEPGAAEATVLGDPGRLQMVVINLCTNAAQAMDGQGVLDIRLGTAEFERDAALSHGPPLAPGRYLRLAVTDTGHGIDAATAERVFEPFFTTKEPGGGTGLGLATAHAVVADHGGRLGLLSRPGAGSTFEVYLPQADASAAAEDPAAEGAIPRGHGESVMIVDDERRLVLLGEEMLAALGYEPAGFDSAPKALTAFRADPGRFDLVLTDQVIPTPAD